MNYIWKALVETVNSFPEPRRMVVKGLRTPWKTVRALLRTGQTGWIKEYCGGMHQYNALRSEIEKSGLIDDLLQQLGERFAHLHGTTVRGNPFVAGNIKRTQGINLYVLVRALLPGSVVETGVCNGFSTACILKALQRNGNGKLYSIDLPEFTEQQHAEEKFWQRKGGAVVPHDKECGWLVPIELRSKWSLQLGRTDEKLPLVLKEIGHCDLFLHDSEHSYENQIFEFRIAWQHLSEKGVLLASDINHSRAFDVFRNEVKQSTVCHFLDNNLAAISLKRP